MLSLTDAPTTSAPSGTTNPFPGPKPYRTEDEPFFFGRQEEIDELTSLVLSTSAIVMDAPSGTGKSSLINAGLLPALEPYHFTVIPVRFGEHARAMRRADATPGGNPFEAAVVAAIGQATGELPIGTSLAKAMEGLRKEGPGGYVLLLDQFEEIFSGFPASWRLRTPFFASLAHGLQLNRTVRLLIAIRSDYIASLAPYQRQIPGELVVRYSLESLRADGAKEAIRQAFEVSGRPLENDQIDSLVMGLLTLRNGDTKLDVLGEFVNLIQLQIICRGHWETKVSLSAEHAEEPGRSSAADGDGDGARHSEQTNGGDSAVGTDGGEPDEPEEAAEGACPSIVDVDSAMNEFVDAAVGHTVTTTGCDEATIRTWLESQLITPGDRRAVVLLGKTETGGLDNDVVEVLEGKRLVAYQQRNDDLWVELTHDSMIRAIHRSNCHWHEARRRGRLRRRNTLALVLAVLVGLFFVLREPVVATSEVEPLAERSGTLTSGPERLEFTVAADQITLVSGDVYSYGSATGGAAPTVQVIRADGEPATLIQGEMTFLDGDSSSGVRHVGMSFVAPAAGRYAAVLEPGEATGDSFDLTITTVPLVITADEAADHVEAPATNTFAIEAPPGAPLLVTVEDGYINDAIGADVLYDDTRAIIGAGDENTLAVLSVSSFGRLQVSTRRLDQDLGHLTTDQTRSLIVSDAAASLVFDNPTPEPVVIGAACETGGTEIVVYDDAQQVVATTATPRSDGPQDEQFVVVTLAQGTYQTLFIGDGYDDALNCTVGARSLGDHTLTGPAERVLSFPAQPGFEVLLLESTTESIAVVDSAPGAEHSLRCGEGGRTTLPGEDGRLVAVVPTGEHCVVVLVHTDGLDGAKARVRLVPLTSAAGAYP